ncbi:MAG: hypothetical protein Q9195_004965 [Heterodermia aff. obscurata]
MTQDEAQVGVPALPDHSTLELVKHDKSVTAPERDHALVAPERGRQRDAPEITPGQGLETLYDDAPPEALPISGESNSADSKSIPAPSARRLSSRRVNIIIVIVMTVIMSLAVGTGAAIGLSKVTKTASARYVGWVPMFAEYENAEPMTLDSPTPVLTDKRILDDTAMAALALPNGDRRLFFQDLSGAIRQAFYSAASRQWRADVQHIVASNAKNHTPIAVVTSPTFMYNITSQAFIPGYLSVLYIFANNSLACVEFVAGRWMASSESGGSGYFTNVSQHTAYAESRSLSVAVSSVGENSVKGWIVYEPTKGDITILNGSLTPPTPSWVWRNITDSFHAALQLTDHQCAAPFAIEYPFIDNASIVCTSTLKNGTYSRLSLDAPPDSLSAPNSSPAAGSEPGLIPPSDLLAMNRPFQGSEETDGETIETYGRDLVFWVKNQTLTPLSDSVVTSPQSLFPFSRLASIVPLNGSDFFIYHQLNASNFAEDRWDDSLSGWISNSFEISMV